MAEQILYSFCESLVRRQAEAERVMLEEFRKGTYTIEKPFVKINPYLINPLAAVVMFMTEEETAVTVTVYGKEARGNIVHTFPPAKEHILPVLGLYAVYLSVLSGEASCGRSGKNGISMERRDDRGCAVVGYGHEQRLESSGRQGE